MIDKNEPKTSVGAPKKRDKAVVKIAEAMGSVLSPEIMSVTDMDSFPVLRDEPPRNQMIMCAVACGFSQHFIAKALKVAQPTINEIIQRIDPDKRFRVSPKARKAFMTQLYESRGMEALVSITPEKLEEATASELARIAKTMTDATQALNAGKHKEMGSSRIEMLQQQLEAEAEDAEFEEISEK